MVIEDNREASESESGKQKPGEYFSRQLGLWQEKQGFQESTGECRKDRACAGIAGRIGSLRVMAEMWKTGNVQSQGRMFDKGQDSGASEKAGRMEGVHGENRTGSKSSPRMLRMLCVNLGRSSVDLGAIGQKGRK